MSTLQFGQLPPGVDSWQALYASAPEPPTKPTRWVRVGGTVEIRITLEQVMEVEMEESDDEIIAAALSIQGVDIDLIAPDWCVNTDYFGITIEPATEQEIARGVKL